MALKMAQSQSGKDVSIFSDSQTAIRVIGGSHMSSQQILGYIIDSYAELRRRGARVAIYWIPAHQEISENERADKAAKEATGWRVSRNARGRSISIDIDATAPALGDLKQPLTTLKRKLKTLAHSH